MWRTEGKWDDEEWSLLGGILYHSFLVNIIISTIRYQMIGTNIFQFDWKLH